MTTQTAFEFVQEKIKRESGGSLLKGKRKTKRILSSQFPIHLVLKSNHAIKEKSFFNHRYKIEHLITGTSYECGVRIFKFAIMNNHIHMAIQIPSEIIYKHWIRALSSGIAQSVCCSSRNSYEANNSGFQREELPQTTGFFTQRPYTRVLSGWGKEFQSLLEYIELNQREAVGIQRPRP